MRKDESFKCSQLFSLSEQIKTISFSSTMTNIGMLFKFIFSFNFMCVGVLSAYMYLYHVCEVPKRATNPLELELQTPVNLLWVWDSNLDPL